MMELPMGDRVYAAERIMKKRVRRVSEIVFCYERDPALDSYADVCPCTGMSNVNCS
jgi:hypothetical protein